VTPRPGAGYHGLLSFAGGAMRRSVAALVSVFAVFALVAGSARAESPEKTFAGKVLLSTKRFPMSAKSPAAYIAQLRKQSASSFYEDKDNHQWKINFAAFFREGLDDVEVQVKIYDVTQSPQQMLSSFDQYLDERGQKSFVSSMILERKQFGVNKQLMITLESHGKVLAAGRFKIIGEAEKMTGKVNFSDDDTKDGSGSDQ
jgi:hypothetical protein